MKGPRIIRGPFAFFEDNAPRTWPVSLVKRNLIANLIGTGWSGLLTLAMAPVYIHLVGVEAFGLIGFQLTMQAVMTLLDFGLGLAVNRELARLTGSAETAHHARVVVRTAEVVHWAVAAVVALTLIAVAPLIATRWFAPRELSPETVATALRLMAIVLALRLPYGVYSSGLLGMQRHVVLNVIVTVAATLRAAGSVALLVWVARDVRLVFAWEALTMAVQTCAAALALHGVMPRATVAARFDFPTLRNTWRFARGVGLAFALGILASQFDKLALSKLLPLSVFGHYTVAVMIAAIVVASVGPVQATIFPRFAHLAAHGDERELATAYHRAAQTLAAILLPIVCVCAFFSRELVLLWVRDAAIAAETRWLVVLLVVASACNALLSVPYALQLAHGWTSLSVRLNAAGLVLMVPLAIWTIEIRGATGAAVASLILQASLLAVGITVMHRRILRGHLGAWLRDVTVPGLAAVGVCAAARIFIEPGHRFLLAELLAVAGTTFAASAMAAPVAREWIVGRLRPQPAER